MHSWNTQHVVIKVVDNSTGDATYLRPDVSSLFILDSAIGQHLINNLECAKTYSDDFRFIGQARSSFHLSVLESICIKTQNPVLCKQDLDSGINKISRVLPIKCLIP